MKGNVTSTLDTTNNVGNEYKLISKKADKTSGVFSMLSSAFYNSAGETPSYTQIRSVVTDSTKGNEKASLYFYGMQGGTLTETLRIDSDGQVTVPVMNDNPSGTPVVVNSFGTLMKGASTYTAEEMDKKLEIIEKLEARLTKLEARIK